MVASLRSQRQFNIAMNYIERRQDSTSRKRDLDYVPPVPKFINGIGSEIEGRRPLDVGLIWRPNEYRGFAPIIVLLKGKRGYRRPSSLIIPFGSKNLENEVLEIPGTNVIAKTVDWLFFSFPVSGLPESEISSSGHLAGCHPNLHSSGDAEIESEPRSQRMRKKRCS